MPLNERELFIAVIQQDQADRPAFLDAQCATDHALRHRVEILLSAHDKAGGLLDLPNESSATVDTGGALRGLRPISEGPGTRIGAYKLLQKIGEGGMGVVYMAEQEVPVRRMVALKIIKPGMDSDQVIARFEAERQALALMDHPSIARVLDGGTTETGRPYFVMELVKGIPITEFCDTAHLSTRDRLDLFIPVCRAIQHAHQKGIIHRDIKPSNVMITLIDGRPTPKVIDFGVAKAISQRLTERTMFTQYGAVVGTLEYMSPEQADLSGLDVDTRGDIYALGVMLYELLTGSTPLDGERLRDSAFGEILRRIKEEDPPKPSTRLGASGERLATLSALRGIDPSALTRQLRGDLDRIVMKAIEKDRSRRYETAVGFARDVERYLAGDPVEACPPSALYRLSKFTKKHRTAMVTATAFAVILVGALIVSTASAFRARRAEILSMRRLAEVTRANATTASALATAKVASQRAVEARDRAEANQYVSQINLAQQYWLSDNVQQAGRLLDECPPSLRNWEWGYLNRTVHPERFILPGNGQFTSRLGFSKDGKRMVAIANNGDSGAVVWDLATRKPLCEVNSMRPGVDRYFVASALSPDGALLAMGDRKGAVSLWDAGTGKFLRELGTLDASVRSVAFSPDGRLVAVARTDNVNGTLLVPVMGPDRNESLKVFEVATGAVVFNPGAGVGVTTAFSPDGKRLLAFKKTPGLRLRFDTPAYLMTLWDTATWKESRTLGDAQSWSFSSDSKRIVLGGRFTGDLMPFLKIVDVATGDLVDSFNPTRAVGDIELDPLGKLIAVAVPFTPLVDIWDVAAHKVVRTLRGHTNQMNGVAFLPDGTLLATCAWDRTIRLWDPRIDAEATRLPGPVGSAISSVAFRPDRARLAFVEGDNKVSLFGAISKVSQWDLATGKAAPSLNGHTNGARRVAYSANGKVLASGARDETARTWDAETGQPFAVFRGHKGWIECLAVSPDGRWVASSSEPPELTKARSGQGPFREIPAEIKVWDARTGVERLKLTGHANTVYQLAFQPDGRVLASADYSGVKLWDLETGAPKGEIKDGSFEGLQFSPDGRLLFVPRSEGIIVHDLGTAKELTRLVGHASGLFGGLTVSPDGKRVASARGTEVKLWEIPAGREILTLPVKIGGIAGLAFTPNGKRLIAAVRDGSLQAWDSEPVVTSGAAP